MKDFQTIPTAKGETILPSLKSSESLASAIEDDEILNDKKQNGIIEDFHAPRHVVGQKAQAQFTNRYRTI